MEGRVTGFLNYSRVLSDMWSSFVRVSHQQYHPDCALFGVFCVFPSTRCGKQVLEEATLTQESSRRGKVGFATRLISGLPSASSLEMIGPA